MIYNTHGNEIKGCSAERHVSHIYSAHMSSRPLGWSKRGGEDMAISASEVFMSDKNKKGILGK